MDDLFFNAFFFSFCVYLSSCTQFLPHLMIHHSHSSGKLPLHLGPFHPHIYPQGPLDLAISATIFPGGLYATLDDSISTAPASVWAILVLISAINGLHATLNENISADLVSVWDGLVMVSVIYTPRSITSSYANFPIRRGIV